MAPHTDLLPKALLSVAGKPFADWQLAWLAAEGVTEVTYSIGHRGDQIRTYVGTGDRWGLEVRYVDEGHTLRGTGGALLQALEQDALREEFLVLYGDSYLRLDIRQVWRFFGSIDKSALMTVYRNDGGRERSNAQLVDGAVIRYEKGLAAAPDELHYIDYGLSVFKRSTVRQWIPADAVADLADTLTALSVNGELAGYEVQERYYEIGSPEGLRELELELQGD